MRAHVSCVAALTLWLGCEKPASREEELQYLRVVVPPDLEEFSHLELASRDQIRIFEGESGKYLGLFLSPSHRAVNRGNRAELSIDYPFRAGDVVRYSWRFMVPENFQTDAPRNRFCLIGQWHDQPNRDRGETWESFPSRSPPVMIGLGELDGRLGISLTYGPTDAAQKQQDLGPVFLQRGQWHRLTVIIRWSRGAEGSLQLFLDDAAEPALSAEGKNMNNDYQHYLKVGMYRHREIATENWLYLADVSVTHVTR